MLIAILIVIILISTFIVYDITSKKNINYNNNGEKINVKDFNVGYTFPYIKNNYSISSNYINNNKISYLNSTIIYPRVLPYVNSCINFEINIHLNNVCEIKYKINGNNMIINSITISDINHYIINNKYYNTSIKISLNKNFYNLFNINAIKENAIYGCVINANNLTTDKINTELLMEDMNNSNYKIIRVINGYYYLKPYTEYRLYSLDNNTLKLIYAVKSASPGNSININISESDLS